jgi:energy-coupling factor transporter ATP-binding protein EcfA2
LFAKTALDELTFAWELLNHKRTIEEKRIAEHEALKWLEYFDLAHLKDKNCFYLSHGERQRLAIAAVVASGAGYLILDEPTKGLDGKRKNALIDLLLRLRSENNTGMSIISHDEAFTGEFTGREIRLKEGEIVNG